jgi:hypothetical protein
MSLYMMILCKTFIRLIIEKEEFSYYLLGGKHYTLDLTYSRGGRYALFDKPILKDKEE